MEEVKKKQKNQVTVPKSRLKQPGQALGVARRPQGLETPPRIEHDEGWLPRDLGDNAGERVKENEPPSGQAQVGTGRATPTEETAFFIGLEKAWARNLYAAAPGDGV